MFIASAIYQFTNARHQPSLMADLPTKSDLLPHSPNVSLLPIRVITPHAGLDAFKIAARSLFTGFAQARRLAWRFFLRDTSAEHRQSLLGYVWLLFPPLANTLIWVFLTGQNVIAIDTGSVAYPVFVLTGTILWAAFNGSLVSMLGIVGGARGLLAKVNFPHEALVYAVFLKVFMDAAIACVLLVPALLLYRVPIQPSMLLFVVALLASISAGSALGLIALPLAALYTDVGRVVQLVLRFGFFLTPVVFPLPAAGFGRQVMLLNPATPIIVSGRAWLTGAGNEMPGAFMAVAAGSLVLIAIGLTFYKVALPHLIERLSS